MYEVDLEITLNFWFSSSLVGVSQVQVQVPSFYCFVALLVARLSLRSTRAFQAKVSMQVATRKPQATLKVQDGMNAICLDNEPNVGESPGLLEPGRRATVLPGASRTEIPKT